MRFTCGNCGRVYVADDRIAGRAFRMRCKRCGHAIAVGSAPAPEPGAAVPVDGSGRPPRPPAPAPGAPSGWEAETAFGELSRELQDGGEEPADGDVLEIQPVPAPPPPPAPAALAPPPPPSTDGESRPAPRGRKVGPALLIAVVVLGAGAAGIRYLSTPASRSAPPAVAQPSAPAERPAPVDANPPPAPPPAAPVAVPTPEERPPGPAAAPPPRGATDRVDGGKRAPVRGPTPTPAPVPAAPAPARVTPPEPAAVPEARPRPDLPPRDVVQLQSSLAGLEKAFDGCVADARRDEPDLLASPRAVVLTMTVRPTGKVAYPTLDDAQLTRTALGSCLKREAARLTFPESGGDPVRVRMPLMLGL